MLGIHEAGAGMGIICSDSDAEPAKSMGRLLRCLSFLHRHDQSRGTTNLDAEWPPQPDNPTPTPTPILIPSSISLRRHDRHPVTGILMIDTSVAITPRNRHPLLSGQIC